MSFEGTDIANDGTVPFRSGERISFSYLISQKYTDEQVSSHLEPEGVTHLNIAQEDTLRLDLHTGLKMCSVRCSTTQCCADPLQSRVCACQDVSRQPMEMC